MSLHGSQNTYIRIGFLIFIAFYTVGCDSDDKYKMKKEILFLEQEQEEANKTVHVSFPELENEISVFGWVKPTKSDYLPQKEVLIFAMQPALTGLPTQQQIEEDLFLFSFILHGNCGHFAYRKNGLPISLVDPNCDLEFFEAEQGEWLFFYVGHSPDLSQTNIFLRMRSRMYTRIIHDTIMNRVQNVAVCFEFLDPKQFTTLQGVRQRFAVGYGKGAYTEIGLNMLSSLHPNQFSTCANFFEENIYSFNYIQICLRNTIMIGNHIRFSCVNVPPGKAVVYVEKEELGLSQEVQFKEGYSCFPSIRIKQAHYQNPT